MLKKELRGRKINITRSMNAEERFHNKRMGYVKYCIHMKHNVPLASITTNWTMKYVSIKGQIVVKTVQSGNLKYLKYQDVQAEDEEQMQKWQSKKTHRNNCEQSCEGNETKRRRMDYELSKRQSHHRETTATKDARVKGGGRDKLKKVS